MAANTAQQEDGRTKPGATDDGRSPADDASGWTDRLSRSRAGLALLSFAESTVLPIPLEAIVVPLMVGHPKRALRIALIIWLGCLVGASVFYAIGYLLADPVVIPTLQFLGLEQSYNDMADRLSQGGLFWTVFLVSFLPAPLQLATLGTGAIGGNFAVFFGAILVSRGLRYFGMAILAQFVGERIAHLKIPKRYLVLGLGAALLFGWGLSKLFGG